MSFELVYTSAPRGLKPGSMGFCTVAATQGMPPGLADRLESLSGYRPLYPLGDPRTANNPVNFCHYRVTAGGRTYHVLSRIGYAPADYSGRSNKLAHHLALDTSEVPPAGPAAVLRHSGLLVDVWSGEPRLLPPRTLPTGVSAHSGPCVTWQQLTGDAGWAGVVAEQFILDPSRPYQLIIPAGADALALLDEMISLLPASQRWQATFSTYFTDPPAGVACTWRMLVDGSPVAEQARRQGGGLLLDLTRAMPAPPASRYVEFARSGRPVGELDPPARGGKTIKVSRTPTEVASNKPAVPSPFGVVPASDPLEEQVGAVDVFQRNIPIPSPTVRRRSRWPIAAAVAAGLIMGFGFGAWFGVSYLKPEQTAISDAGKPALSEQGRGQAMPQPTTQPSPDSGSGSPPPPQAGQAQAPTETTKPTTAGPGGSDGGGGSEPPRSPDPPPRATPPPQGDNPGNAEPPPTTARADQSQPVKPVVPSYSRPDVKQWLLDRTSPPRPVIVFGKVTGSTTTDLYDQRASRVMMEAKLPDTVSGELVLAWDLEAPKSSKPKPNEFEVRDGFEPEIHLGKADGANPLRWERIALIRRNANVLQLEVSGDQALHAEKLLAFLDNHFVAVADKSGKVLYRCQFRSVLESVVGDLGAQNAVQLKAAGHPNNAVWWFEGRGVKPTGNQPENGIAFEWRDGQVPGNDGSHEFKVDWAAGKVSLGFRGARELVRRNVKTKQEEADRLDQTIKACREALEATNGDDAIAKESRARLNTRITSAIEAKSKEERERDLWQGWLDAMDSVKLIVVEFQNENGVVLERVELRGPAYMPANDKEGGRN